MLYETFYQRAAFEPQHASCHHSPTSINTLNAAISRIAKGYAPSPVLCTHSIGAWQREICPSIAHQL
jgi:hypothetical protein